MRQRREGLCEAFLTGEIDVPSWLAAHLPPGEEALSISRLEDRLAHSALKVRRVEPLPQESHVGHWSAKVLVDWPGELGQYKLSIEHAERLHELHLNARGLSDHERRTTSASKWVIGIEAKYGLNSLADYHRQLQILHAIVPDTPSVFDVNACSLIPGSWARTAALTKTAPDPRNLFTIHAVRDERDPNAMAWLHTHGLLRCGIIELEMLEVEPCLAAEMANMINAVALIFMHGGMPPPDTPFEPVSGMNLVWLPIEDGLKKFRRQINGGEADRDEDHVRPSGVLLCRSSFGPFARYRTPNGFASLLSDNPIFAVPTPETERMASMARERFGEFARWFERHGQDVDGWVFVVKLGYPIDDAESDTEREHLWFRVQKIRSDRIYGKLANEPYHIERLHEGQVGWHDLDKLTDFQIICEAGTFNPDKIFLLGGELEKAAGQPRS